MSDLAAIKAAYRIGAAWRDLSLPRQSGKCVPSPLREDHSPSFSVFEDGTRWKDHATGDGGDVFDFIRQAQGCSMADAIRFVENRLGITPPERKPDAAKKAGPKLPPLRAGTADESGGWQTGAGLKSRRCAWRSRVDFYTSAICGDTRLGVSPMPGAHFSSSDVWTVKWPAEPRRQERKAHCTGTGKAWPLGSGKPAVSKNCNG